MSQYRDAVLVTGPAGYWRLGEAAASTVSDISVANPTHITTSTPHGILNGATVVITGSTGGTPTINGTNVATVIDATHFTIPVNVTVAGSGGTVNIQYAADEMGANNLNYYGVSTPPTRGAMGLLTGDSNTAASFNGVNQTIYKDAAPVDVSGTNLWTLAVWLQTTPDGSLRYVMALDTAAQYGAFIGVTNAGSYLFRANAGGSDIVSGAVCSSAIPHLLAGTYDGTTIRFYLDGAPSGIPVASSRVLPASTRINVGGGYGSSAPPSGTVDEGAIWNRALSAAEVAALWAAGSTIRGTVVASDAALAKITASDAALAKITASDAVL